MEIGIACRSKERKIDATMNIQFETVNDINRKAVQGLKVAKGQEGYIEPVTECLEEAGQFSCWRPVAVYDGEKLIGFAMYCRWKDSPHERVWLDRLLIDARYQGKGYGKACLSKLLERLKAEYGCGEIYLSVFPENKVAIRLYEEFGFRFNGEKDIHNEDVMVLVC